MKAFHCTTTYDRHAVDCLLHLVSFYEPLEGKKCRNFLI